MQRFQGFIQSRPPARSLQDFIRDNYLVYQSPGRNAQDEVLFTGYYEPLLRGSRSRKPEYAYPVYPRPEDLVTVDLGTFSEKFKGEKITGRLTDRALVPYYERREIEEDGVLYRENSADRLGQRPGRPLLPAHPGLGQDRARRRPDDQRPLRRRQRPALPQHRAAADRRGQGFARGDVHAAHPGLSARKPP